MTRHAIGALAMCTAVSLTVACAGASNQLSRDAFVEQGDELCTGYNDTSGRLIAQIVDEDSGAQGEDSLEASEPVLRDMAGALSDHVGRLDELVPPGDAQEAFAAARDLLRQGAGALGEAADGAASGDLRRTQQSFERYAKAVDSAAAWASRYGFRACARRVTIEETEEAEIEGAPLPPAELAAFCAEVAGFSDALASLPRDSSAAELEERLLDLSLRAAALADLPPPGTGSALGEVRAALEAVTKEAAEHGYDLGAAAAEGADVLAPLESARAALEVRVFGIGACSGT